MFPPRSQEKLRTREVTHMWDINPKAKHEQDRPNLLDLDNRPVVTRGRGRGRGQADGDGRRFGWVVTTHHATHMPRIIDPYA